MLLGKLQNDFDEVQQHYSNLMSALTSQWEERFNSLERQLNSSSQQWEHRFASYEATMNTSLVQWEQRFTQMEQNMNNGIKVATSTAVSMSERANKFMQLGELLERTLRQVDTGSDQDSPVWQKVESVERDLVSLAQKLDSESLERSRSQEVIRQAESQINVFLQSINSSKFQDQGMRGQPIDVSQPQTPSPNVTAYAVPQTGSEPQPYHDSRLPLPQAIDCGPPAATITAQAVGGGSEPFSELLKRIRELPSSHTGVANAGTTVQPATTLVGSKIDETAPVSMLTEEDTNQAGTAVEAVRAALARLRDENQQTMVQFQGDSARGDQTQKVLGPKDASSPYDLSQSGNAGSTLS